MDTASPSSKIRPRLPVRALLVGEQIDPTGFDARDLISTVPVAVRVHPDGLAVLFRYGVVVLIGLKPQEETAFLRPEGANFG